MPAMKTRRSGRVLSTRWTSWGQPAASLYNDFTNFTNAIALHSALMPERSARAICLSYMPERSLDRSALPTNKFTYFLDEVTCKSRKRNNSGRVCVVVLLTKLYQGSYEKMLEFIAKSCHYQAKHMLS